MDLEVLDEIVLGSARGGKRRAADVEIQVVRALTEADLDALQSPDSLGSEPPGLLALRSTHHQLAQLIATGTEMVEVSLITGYSLSYISNLKRSPAFEELVQHYTDERAQVFVEAQARLKAMGITAIEILHQSMLDEPEKWAKRELMEMAELVFGKGSAGPQAQAKNGQSAGPGGISIAVNFVAAQGQGTGPIIEATARQVGFDE